MFELGLTDEGGNSRHSKSIQSLLFSSKEQKQKKSYNDCFSFLKMFEWELTDEGGNSRL
jgi:hypothetical protein